MSQTLYELALVAHVVGITIMAGTTFIDFITFRIFWKTFRTDQGKSLVLENYLYKLQQFLGIGMIVILVSGVLMMVKLHEVWGAQLWFRIKMGVLLLIIINGLGLRRILGSKLKRAFVQDSSGNTAMVDFDSVKWKLTTVQAIQILLFLTIYVLSIFKFN